MNQPESASQRQTTNLSSSTTPGKAKRKLSTPSWCIAGKREGVQAEEFCHKRKQIQHMCIHRSEKASIPGRTDRRYSFLEVRKDRRRGLRLQMQRQQLTFPVIGGGRDMTSAKDNLPVTNPKTRMYSLPNKEFKITVSRMLRELQKQSKQ